MSDILHNKETNLTGCRGSGRLAIKCAGEVFVWFSNHVLFRPQTCNQLAPALGELDSPSGNGVNNADDQESSKTFRAEQVSLSQSTVCQNSCFVVLDTSRQRVSVIAPPKEERNLISSNQK